MNEFRIGRWAAVIFVTLAILAGGLIGSLAAAKTHRTVPLFATTQPVGGGEQVSFDTGFTPIVQKALPAVVNISSTKTVKVPGGNPALPFLNDPFFASSSAVRDGSSGSRKNNANIVSDQA